MTERHALNAPGNRYVDTRCIDCSAAYTLAPGLIVGHGGQAVFARQPATPEERLQAWRDVCWWSWPDQLQSLRTLLGHRFEWVFAGHGGSHHRSSDEMAARLAALLERLEAALR